MARLLDATCLPLLAACGGASEMAAPPQPTPPRRVSPYTVRLATWGSEDDRLLFTRIAADFSRRADDIDLEVEHANHANGDESRSRAWLAARIADGTVADLVSLPGAAWHEFAARGSLHPLGELAARDKWSVGWPRDEAYEYQSQFRGKRYFVPSSADPHVIFYRPDHFRDAGVALPRPDWSYVEFQDTARRLTRRVDGQRVYGYLWSAGYLHNVPWWRMHGAGEWDRIAEPRKAGWTAPAIIEALQYQLYDSQYTLQISPRYALLKSDPSHASLAAGRVAMKVDGPAQLRRLAAVPFDVQVFPTGQRGAYGDRRRAHVNPLQGHVMTKNSKDRDAAWEALKWIGSEPGQARVAAHGRLCSVPDLARKLWLPLARVGVAGAGAFVRAMEGSTIDVTGEVTEYVLNRDAGLGAALGDVRDGNATAKEALGRLQPRIQSLLDRYWEAQGRL